MREISKYLSTLPNDERHLWDVFAVDIKTGGKRLMQGGMTERNAEAYITMAVMRRGVDTEFFMKEPHEKGEK